MPSLQELLSISYFLLYEYNWTCLSLLFVFHSMKRRPMIYLSSNLVRRTQGRGTPKTGWRHLKCVNFRWMHRICKSCYWFLFLRVCILNSVYLTDECTKAEGPGSECNFCSESNWYLEGFPLLCYFILINHQYFRMDMTNCAWGHELIQVHL